MEEEIIKRVLLISINAGCRETFQSGRLDELTDDSVIEVDADYGFKGKSRLVLDIDEDSEIEECLTA